MLELSAAAALGPIRYDGVPPGKLAASLSSTVRRRDSSVVTKATMVWLNCTGDTAWSCQTAASSVLWQPATEARSVPATRRCRAACVVLMIDPPALVEVGLRDLQQHTHRQL